MSKVMESTVYESHKKALRLAMNRLDYNIYRGWELPADEDGTDDGYLVEHLDGGTPNHPDHDGYVSWSPKAQFDNGYTEVVRRTGGGVKGKTLHNSTVSGARQNVKDIQVFGNGDTFQLICKASSKNEGWMKSTKAMQIAEVGCLVQVTTQQGNNVSEALAFVPGVKIESINGDKSSGRELVAI